MLHAYGPQVFTPWKSAICPDRDLNPGPLDGRTHVLVAVVYITAWFNNYACIRDARHTMLLGKMYCERVEGLLF